MNREAMTKGLMVVVLLGALGVTVKLAVDAQRAEQAKEARVAEGPDEAVKREVRGILRRAIHAHRQLDYETAEKLLRDASERYPDIAAVWLNLGICYRSLDKLDAADRAFARVLEINAQDWDAIAERATVRLMRGQTDEAFTMLSSIPANKGQVNERLRSDPDWRKARGDARMPALLEKHGVVADGDTGLRQAQQVLEQRKAQQRAPQPGPDTSTPAPASPAPASSTEARPDETKAPNE